MGDGIKAWHDDLEEEARKEQNERLEEIFEAIRKSTDFRKDEFEWLWSNKDKIVANKPLIELIHRW